ncbi:c-type cytochrome [Cereibacter azotoformans]|uniref:c-type cytochrome n=1 Tax=Cereibacter azotoformans TaxID=43057 RepID=UPI003B21D22E
MKARMMAATCLVALSGAALAADREDAGRNEYRAACAGCHGESAKGDGPVGPILNIEMPDLTKLSAANDGEFPFQKTFMIVDGRAGVRAHGDPMPIWGDRFKAEAAVTGGYAAEIMARGRLLALVQYLESIQE